MWPLTFLTGFGVSAPSTLSGKILLVLYGLVGCSATILFFNLFLERVRASLTLLICWCHSRRAGKSGLDVSTGGGTRSEVGKPSINQVAVILFAAVLLVACGAASLYSAMEGWTFIESLYFCFVAFSTVGFGDFVSGQRAQHQNFPAYQIANCLVMLIGVCCTYSLFSALSLIIKQGLNWMLSVLAQTRGSACCYKSKVRTLSKFCITEPQLTHPCSSEDNAQQSQQAPKVMCPDHNMLWTRQPANVMAIKVMSKMFDDPTEYSKTLRQVDDYWKKRIFGIKHFLSVPDLLLLIAHE